MATTTCEMCGEQFDSIADYVVHELEAHDRKEMIETCYLKPMKEGRHDKRINDNNRRPQRPPNPR